MASKPANERPANSLEEDTPEGLSRAVFQRDLRRALAHLYHPAKLRTSPLVGLLTNRREDEAGALQRLLLEGIQALKPDKETPPSSNAWRTFHVLSQRYGEQLTQREVSADLGLSIRQLRREETLGLRMLAAYFYARHHQQLAARYAGSSLHADGEDATGTATPTRKQEIDWLRRSLPSEPVQISDLAQVVLRTVAPLAQALGVRAEYDVPESLPRLAVQVTTMRQALLTILTAAIRAVPRGRVHVRAERYGRDVQLHIQPLRVPSPSPALLPEDVESLEIARELVSLSGGVLDVATGDQGKEPFTARLLLPAVQQVSVLFIDDNADTLHLLERYLSGTRYRFLAAPDPQQALSLAEELAPEVVVLDVMLPGIDGWEILGQLREHPRTRPIPVIVCTILPHEQLALTLGAAMFLRKPVSQQALLAALDRLLERSETGSGS